MGNITRGGCDVSWLACWLLSGRMESARSPGSITCLRVVQGDWIVSEGIEVVQGERSVSGAGLSEEIGLSLGAF